MSEYRNFINDFPSRCRELLRQFNREARLRNRDVTLILAVAASGIIIPYARLRECNHPSSDALKFAEAAASMKAKMELPLFNSGFVEPSANSWRIGEIEIRDGFHKDNIHAECRHNLREEEKTEDIVRIIRNALAHGNIITDGDPIKTIFFLSRLSRKSQVYKCLGVTVEEFRKFLEKWFHFLSTLNMPEALCEDTDIFGDHRAA